MEALVRENNELLVRVQQRARQNHLLLSHCVELMQQLINSIFPVSPPPPMMAADMFPGGGAPAAALPSRRLNHYNLMLGLFGTLNLASQSLQTQMTGMEVTGQNLANVNTTGYSRQRRDITTSPDSNHQPRAEGTGADRTSIQQVVSQLAEQPDPIAEQHQRLLERPAVRPAKRPRCDWMNFSTAPARPAAPVPPSTDTTDTGLDGQLSSLFNAFQSVATSPTSVSARQSLGGRRRRPWPPPSTISTRQLSQVNTSLNASLSSGVTSANQLLTKIATLNSRRLPRAQARAAMPTTWATSASRISKTSQHLTNITTSTGNNGAVNVTIGGQTLVSGNTVNDTLQTYDAGDGQLLVQTASGGVQLTLTGGSIQGTIDARDNTLATVQGNLNTLANTVVSQVNNILDNGYSSTGGTGNTFFTGSDASSIAVNAAVTNNPSLIQISSSSTSSGDNLVALQVSDLSSTAQSALNNQTFTDSYDSTITDLGTALDDANTEATDQTTVSDMLSTQRSSVSGVNLDEEMTNMMSFQSAYEASAQVVTTVNTLLGDTMTMKTS